jgi:hypothetical protein
LTTALAAGTAVDFTCQESAGFTIGQVVTLGYGTDREETVNTHASAVTEADGTGNAIEVAAGQTLNHAHPVNERVTIVGAAIQPGSVVITLESTGTVGTDALGDGVITGATLQNSYVDYSCGAIYVNFASSDPDDGKEVSYTAHTLNDAPAMEDIQGRGFFKNFPVATQTRQGAPSYAAVSNLGSTDVGVFFEVSKNNGKSFSMRGATAAGSTMGSLGRKVLTVPNISGEVHELVRVRAGATAGTGVTQTETTRRMIADGLVEVDTTTIQNANGGSV